MKERVVNTHERKGDDMNTTVNNEYKKLDKSKLRNRKRTIVSSEETLKDITPINWSDEVLNGTRKVSFTVCK